MNLFLDAGHLKGRGKGHGGKQGGIGVDVSDTTLKPCALDMRHACTEEEEIGTGSKQAKRGDLEAVYVVPKVDLGVILNAAQKHWGVVRHAHSCPTRGKVRVGVRARALSSVDQSKGERRWCAGGRRRRERRVREEAGRE